MTEGESHFLKVAVPAALLSQRETGVPASITIAQAILESGWGCSALARLGLNFFGIKAEAYVHPDGYIELPTHEVVNGHSVEEQARFARYATVADSFKAHAWLLSAAHRYARAMEARQDAAKFAAALETCGYSTDPHYGQSLMRLVTEFDLTQYDVPQPKGGTYAV